MDTWPLFQQPSHFASIFGKVKLYAVISLGLVCGVTGCDLGTDLSGEVKKKIEENKTAFQIFFNQSGVPRQE